MIVTSKDDLRKKSESVSYEEGLEIGLKLADELKKWDIGIGLSAPQIGIFKRVFVALDKNKDVKIYINPEIFQLNQPFVFKKEGCLSFPGIEIDTIRYRTCLIKDDHNNRQLLDNLEAVVVQHEKSHLDGKLMFDFKIPGVYDQCVCSSGKKFKFCCKSKLRND